MKIESGLFSGIVIPESEIVFLRNDSADATPWWAPVFRTPHFIQKFSPLDGWSVIVNAKPGEFNLPDYENTQAGEKPPVQPTQLFEATLVKEGIVYATASSLEIIDGEKAWERGETNCRGRLYEALGLPGSLKGTVPAPGNAQKNTTKPGQKPPLVVVPMAAAPAQTDQVQQQPAVTLVEVQAQQHVTDSDSASETPSDQSEPESTTTEATSADVTPTTPVQSGPIQHAPGINANLLSQIERQARLVGVPVRSLSSNDDAKKFFAELLSQSNTKAAS